MIDKNIPPKNIFNPQTFSQRADARFSVDKGLRKTVSAARARPLGAQLGVFKAAILLAALSAYCVPAFVDSSYQRAKVLSSTPVYQTVVYEEPREVCRQERVAYEQNFKQSRTPAIIGALVGGALGNAVGRKKSNKRVGAVVGSVLGYSIAKDIGRHKRQHSRRDQVTYRQEEVCDIYYDEREEQQLLGYDVSYIYAGQTYNTRLDRDPGASLRVRVAVNPA